VYSHNSSFVPLDTLYFMITLYSYYFFRPRWERGSTWT